MKLAIKDGHVTINASPAEFRDVVAELTALLAEVERHHERMTSQPHSASWCRETFDAERHHVIGFTFRCDSPPTVAPTEEPG